MATVEPYALGNGQRRYRVRIGHRIVERPVRFAARSRSAGKKMRWRDGWMALRVLVVERFRGR